MNIKLRGEVLESALILENAVNNLALLYLGIKKENRRAIGHKSGTLTFKNVIGSCTILTSWIGRIIKLFCLPWN